ncbi:ABC transporter substrate binding protein [Variovorax sp. LjRoot290]|uniref:ABC transporter substrate binding protein n=1 Tax=unclassified Variovorax TaxID=663243 RepID=UPI003ECC2B90
MFANRSPALFQGLRTIAGMAIAVLLAGGANAAGLTVLVADELAAHTEFVRLLRESQEAGSRFDLVRLPAGGPVPELAGAGEDRVMAGVRTRGMRPSAPAEVPVTMAVGPVAARAAIERPGQDPLVLVMLSRLDYESLKTSPALRRTDRHVGVLLREPAMADQLTLIDAVLPQKRRLGVVATAESEPIVRELQRAAQGWDLQVEYAPDATSLASVLRVLVPRSDALMVLPDLIGDSQAATLSVLRAGAGAGLPVFGTSDGLVRSGGLAAAVSTPGQLALQARALGQKVAAAPAGAGVLVEAATPATVRINATVARGLGLRIPEERELTERVTATR